MSADRINFARRLAASLKNDYDTSNINGLRQIAADNRIILIESPKIIIPETSYAYPQPVIFTGKSWFPAYNFVALAHELAHALIPGHSRGVGYWDAEREARLFSYELASRSYRFRYIPEGVLDSIGAWLLRPHDEVRFHWSSLSHACHRAYLHQIYAENIDRFYNEINN